ncbi:MAG TPA: hypothetical protein VKU60_14290, partial [Chloroflexota bacterium]|nr:hypothetical protein [Chloroflexota bacterium]
MRRWRSVEVGLLLLLFALAAYLWTAPQRRERFLRTASLAQLDEAARQEANNPRVFYYQGVRLQQQGQADLARAAYERAARLNADDEQVWLAWADASARLPDMAE